MAIVLDGSNLSSFSGAVQASGVAINLYPLVSGTSVASTSGTSIDFTGIPSWVKRITVMFQGVSTNGTSNLLIQLGDSGGIETSGYLGAGAFAGTSTGGANYTAGFGINGANAANVMHGSIIISNFASGNEWIAAGNIALSSSAFVFSIGGSKSLSDTLTQIRITTVNGTDTFDAGTINILYE
jgi:hypothetical protein